jgi:hypothetical protein
MPNNLAQIKKCPTQMLYNIPTILHNMVSRKNRQVLGVISVCCWLGTQQAADTFSDPLFRFCSQSFDQGPKGLGWRFWGLCALLGPIVYQKKSKIKNLFRLNKKKWWTCFKKIKIKSLFKLNIFVLVLCLVCAPCLLCAPCLVRTWLSGLFYEYQNVILSPNK